jgi:hypothetical protein
MEENKPLSELTDDEVFDLVKAGQDGHKWTLGLYREVLRRGPEILDRDPDLRAVWDAYHEERNERLKALLDIQAMPKLFESIRLISDSNRELFEKIAKSMIPESFGAALLRSAMPKFEMPKYDFPKLGIPKVDYPSLDYALRADVVKQNPELEALPIDSSEVQKATESVVEETSKTVELLTLILESGQLTADRVKPAKWQLPVAILTLVFTFLALVASVVIPLFK